jgi:hypothetical protein
VCWQGLDPDDTVTRGSRRCLEKMGDRAGGWAQGCAQPHDRIYQRGKQVIQVGDMRMAMDGGKITGYGQKLNELGGLDLMKRAFAIFSRYSNWPPEVPRDLFSLWVGIGDWGKQV